LVQRKVPLNNQISELEVEGHKFKRIQQFKFLGAILTQQNEINSEVKARIQAGNKCYFGLTKLLRSRALSTNLKIQIYWTLIKRSNLWVGNMDVAEDRRKCISCF